MAHDWVRSGVPILWATYCWEKLCVRVLCGACRVHSITLGVEGAAATQSERARTGTKVGVGMCV